MDQQFRNPCLKSGAIGNSSETLVTLSYEAAEADSIGFYFKVSSESGYDKLYFYIDNQEQANWSGTVGWTRAQYAITAGNHTFGWKYKKDGSVTGGSDCAWIDFIILPRDNSLAASAGLDVSSCGDEPAHILGYATNYETLNWTTAGDGTFSDATIADPMYTPGTQDLANGSVTLTLTATKGNNSITDDVDVNIFEPVSICYGLLEMNYCAVSEPQNIVVTVEGNYTSFLWTTSGSGEFENANELSTTYTPSAEDIEAGNVTLLATATSEGCGPISLEYPFEMHLLPVLTLETESIDICESESVIMNFSSSNGASFVVINGEGYQINENSTSVDLGTVPAGTTVFNITEVQGYMPCSVGFEEGEFTFTVNAEAATAVPELSGATDLDVRVTPTSNYTVVNDVMVEYTIEPAEAGTMLSDNDGKTIQITWSNTFKGDAVLTATPIDECNSGNGTLNITVRNSTGVSELDANTKLYPNPTYGKVNIECQGMTRVSIYNTVGQMVYDKEVDTDQVSIDLSQQPTGSYLVRIITEQGTVVKKLNLQ